MNALFTSNYDKYNKMKIKYFKKLYNIEALHSMIYKVLSIEEKDKNTKLYNNLIELSRIEEKHMHLWAEAIRINRIKIPELRIKTTAKFLLVLRRIFGIALLIKMLEYSENNVEQNLNKLIKLNKISKQDLKIVEYIEEDELKKERILEDKLVGFNDIFNNIKDIAFGLNDGLVEILAVIAGIAMVVSNPMLVVLSGFIVSMAGTFSMGGGAFISSEYEKNIKHNNKSSAKSGLRVGLTYFIGSLFPLSPFIFGFSGLYGIILSIMVTTLVIAIVSYIIAIVSNMKASSLIFKSLIVSLSIDAITIFIGYIGKRISGVTSY
ncbi:MAG: VIT1/CCC1 transporter family protein [Candidatus Micrarchaeia archaeon]